MHYALLEGTLIILSSVLLVNLSFRYLKMPVILGYLVVGVLIGPDVIGWINDKETIAPLAEFGVVLLMFTIGLEFSLSRLLSLKNKVFILGTLQVVLSILITALIGKMLNMTWVEAILTGSVVAMSSTAVVVKILSDQFEIHAPHGLNAIGILLFQDLAVIPILSIIATLTAINDNFLAYTLLTALIKGIIAILVIFVAGRWLLRPLFHFIAAQRVIELFTLCVLFIAIGSAWITAKLGMTLVLGAFLSGIMLGETEFRHQIKSEIRPFRDILLGLFFVSIGMLANITVWTHTWPWILLLLIAIVLGKALLIFMLCYFFGDSEETACRTGLILGQGGEFGFVIFALAHDTKLMPENYDQVVLAALLISFAIAPLIITYNQRITRWIFPANTHKRKKEAEKRIEEATEHLANHTIICGFGRVGQHVARFLKKSKIPYICFDLDPDIIQNASLAGEPIMYGNVTDMDIIHTARVDKAAALVLCFNDISASMHLLSQLKLMDIKIPTLVRCKDETEFEMLRSYDSIKIITEVFEESLTIANYLLRLLKVPTKKINFLLQQARADDYQLLSPIFPGSFINKDSELLISKHLRSVFISERSQAIGKMVNELDMIGVKIISIIRNERPVSVNKVKLLKGDIVILYGLPDLLDKVEKQLMQQQSY